MPEHLSYNSIMNRRRSGAKENRSDSAANDSRFCHCLLMGRACLNELYM